MNRVGLAAFCLLAFATSASAECAWVLWEYTTETHTDEPVRAYTTKQECDQAIAYLLRPGPTVVERDEKSQSLTVMIGKEVTTYGWKCLPDTVDPRGPKGK